MEAPQQPSPFRFSLEAWWEAKCAHRRQQMEAQPIDPSTMDGATWCLIDVIAGRNP